MSTCAATGCQHVIPRWLLMCPGHWDLVPVAIKREVNRTHRVLKDPAPATVFIEKRRAYLQACNAAVQAVAKKQHAKKDRSEAQIGSIFGPESAPVVDNTLSKAEHGNTNKRQRATP